MSRLLDLLADQATIGRACPRGARCTVSSCRDAFACGALPERWSGLGFILRWTLGVGAATFLLGIVLVVMVSSLGEPSREPPEFALAMGILASLCATPPAITLLITFLMSYWQHRHVRALCEAAEATGLQQVDFVRVPDELRSALPAIVPGGSLRRDNPVSGDTTSTVVLWGIHDRRRMIVTRLEFLIDPMDYSHFGTAMKIGAGLVKPGLLINRDSQKQWLAYLVAALADPLENTPDLVLCPNHRIDGWFIQQSFRGRFIDLPHIGSLPRYQLAAASQSLPPERLLGRPLLDQLAQLPGWSIQVISGHLLVWHGYYHSSYRSELPQSGQRITELVRFASQVHQQLSNPPKQAH